MAETEEQKRARIRAALIKGGMAPAEDADVLWNVKDDMPVEQFEADLRTRADESLPTPAQFGMTFAPSGPAPKDGGYFAFEDQSQPQSRARTFAPSGPALAQGEIEELVKRGALKPETAAMILKSNAPAQSASPQVASAGASCPTCGQPVGGQMASPPPAMNDLDRKRLLAAVGGGGNGG
jgi:hypothetical protein